MILHAIHTWDVQSDQPGFRFVHVSQGIPSHVLDWLECRSGIWLDQDGQPVDAMAHRILRFHGAEWSVLTRVVCAEPSNAPGADRCTHHVLIRSDLRRSGPVALLSSALMCDRWPHDGLASAVADAALPDCGDVPLASTWASLFAHDQAAALSRVIMLPQDQPALKAAQAIEAAMPPTAVWSWTFAIGPPAHRQDVGTILLESSQATDTGSLEAMNWSEPPSPAPSSEGISAISTEQPLHMVRLDPPGASRWPVVFMAIVVLVLAIVLWFWLGAPA